MQIEGELSFDRVRDVFLQQNPHLTAQSADYALELLGAANRRFAKWFRGTLSAEDISGIMLPPHNHEGNRLIPPSGSTVSEVVGRVELLPRSDVCRRRIEDLSRGPLSVVFLSATPLADPGYGDYRDLVNRGYKGLTHLDGLHRLIAWARSGRSGIVAYVAGALGS
jgi:hypothetical protein